MDDEIAHELIEHSYALATWILRYIENNNLPVAEDPSFPSFEFNLKRLGSILDQWRKPLSYNPIEGTETKRKRHLIPVIILLALVVSHYAVQHYAVQASAPNGLPRPSRPNVDDALPYVR
jgi:hypothetical protein